MANAIAKDLMSRATKGETITLDWMEDDPAPKVEATVDPVKALELTIAELKGQVMSLSNANTVNGVPQRDIRPSLPTEPDFTKLPDPVTQPAEYGKAVQDAIALANQNKEYLARWDNAQLTKASKAAEKLHTSFAKKFPEYAKNRKAVELFASEAVEDAIAGGTVDANKYMFGTQDVFFADVVAKMDEAGFGKKALEKDADEGEDDASGRAVGVPDGHAPGGGKTAKADVAPASMFSSLNTWRAKTGHIA